MTTKLILSLAITLALAMLLVPAVGTVVFAQNMTGGIGGNMSGGNMSGGNTTGGMTGGNTTGGSTPG